MRLESILPEKALETAARPYTATQDRRTDGIRSHRPKRDPRKSARRVPFRRRAETSGDPERHGISSARAPRYGLSPGAASKQNTYAVTVCIA
jgi:hypothetical protein